MKKIRKAIWIPTLVVGIVAIAVLTLSLIKVSPIENAFGGYSRVELLRSGSSEFAHVQVDGEDVTAKALNTGLESTKFSVMQAVLEGKFSYAPKLQKVESTDEEGNKTEKETTVSSSAIKTYSASDGEYVIRFYYDQTKTIEIDGKTIKFDRVLVRLYETNGEIKDVECVPYLYYNVYNESTSDTYDEDGKIGSIYYNANVVELKMNTSSFMSSVKELLALYE